MESKAFQLTSHTWDVVIKPLPSLWSVFRQFASLQLTSYSFSKPHPSMLFSAHPPQKHSHGEFAYASVEPYTADRKQIKRGEKVSFQGSCKTFWNAASFARFLIFGSLRANQSKLRCEKYRQSHWVFFKLRMLIEADNLTLFHWDAYPKLTSHIPITEVHDKFWLVHNFLLSFEE